MVTREISMSDCSPVLEKLIAYKAHPSPQGVAWARNHWHDPKAIVGRIEKLAKESRFRPGKGKAVVCAVLGAALAAAQEDRQETMRAEQADKEKIQSLQDLVKVLQEQLTAERNTTQRLHAALSDALDRERILRAEADERSDPNLDLQGLEVVQVKQQKSLYPNQELECTRKVFYPEDEEIAMRPLIKTETIDNGQIGGAPHVTIKTIPYSATELSKIQEKYIQLAKETKTEYVWRVSLTGGDRILLSEDEAQGYWGPGVFLTTDDPREPWSLTQRAAYWAGGIDQMERGEPTRIDTPSINQLTESLQKTACLQLMHDRRLVPQQPSPMLLNANPDRMTPLIRGLPDSLKLYAVQLQDRLRDAIAPRGGRRNAGGALTWGEVAQELINYGRRMGLTREESRAKPAIRRIEGPGRPPPSKTVNTKKPYGGQRNLLWAEGIEKGIPRDVMDGLPTSVLEKLVLGWKDKNKEPPHTESNIRDYKGAIPQSLATPTPQTPTAPEEGMTVCRTGN
ncbi:PREDICTED: uncharacterized protein LOC104828198 [Haliaeetus leucocephalus]|uniref:uncharacterized protein LOC104828198 n=1 Tax=Haliaeetus leucocephalus TaxID=52644 RepID=UPI00053CAACF|nr:PREDICTED: uncharacterized protein LOC104828198 [Haliaeetus leucocephalus]